MEEQLISFETAKLAREKGFDWDCYYKYNIVKLKQSYDGGHNSYIVEIGALHKAEAEQVFTNYIEEYCSAPTQSLLQKWLRDEKKIDIEITTYKRMHYQYAILMVPPIDRNRKMYGTYENALEDALKASLV